MQGCRDLLCPQSLSLVRVVYSGMMQLCSKTPMNTQCYPLQTRSLLDIADARFKSGIWELVSTAGLSCSSPSEGHAGAARNAAPPPFKPSSGYLRLHPRDKTSNPKAKHTHQAWAPSSCSSDKCFLLLRLTNKTTKGWQGAVEAEELQTSAVSPKLSLGWSLNNNNNNNNKLTSRYPSPSQGCARAFCNIKNTIYI